MSIGRALKCKLRIQQFCENHIPKPGEGIENDRLNAQHWLLLQKLHDALQPFYEASLCSQGNNNTLSDWFYTLDYVLDSIGKTKSEFETLATRFQNLMNISSYKQQPRQPGKRQRTITGKLTIVPPIMLPAC
jgi:hypothetical protein